MLTRQKILLKMVADSGGSLSRLKLFKLAFLLSKQGESEKLSTFYQFLPYLYGPYSFTLNYELERLASIGAVKLFNKDIELTTIGSKLALSVGEPRLLKDLELLETKYGVLEQSALVDVIYDKFPWFTINSVQPIKCKDKKNKASCANYTIGYQSYQVDGLLNVLLEQGIERLIDTRFNPVSRRYGFHKSTLFALCSKVGIEYIHIPEVGIPSEWRQELETEQSYISLFKRYNFEILNKQSSLLTKLALSMNEKPSALLCRELECHHCHRSHLAKRLSEINGLPVNELGLFIQEQYENTRVLITVMTYPHPSKHYTELVCTAGITDRSEWVRLYPIDYRYRPKNQQFHKYQWIEVGLLPHGSGNDNRKESRKPDLSSIKLLGAPLSTKNFWSERRAIIDRVPTYTLNQLKKLNMQDKTSLGIVQPKRILDLKIEVIDTECKPKTF